jgi:hypothetical protein
MEKYEERILKIDLIDALEVLLNASDKEIKQTIISDYGEDELEVIADSLAFTSVMLKYGGAI